MTKLEEIVGPLEELTKREVEILTWAAKGKTRDQISTELSLSSETIKHYASKTLHKLGATNQTNAVAIACTLGFIQPYSWTHPTNHKIKNITQMGDAIKK